MSITCFWDVERVSREIYAPHPSHHPYQEEFYIMGSSDIVRVGFSLLWCLEMGQCPAVSL
jgi:hypothetical protein